jgi:hypothetical protein
MYAICHRSIHRQCRTHCEHTMYCTRPIWIPPPHLSFAASSLTHPRDQLPDSCSLIPGSKSFPPISRVLRLSCADIAHQLRCLVCPLNICIRASHYEPLSRSSTIFILVVASIKNDFLPDIPDPHIHLNRLEWPSHI